MAIWIFKQSIAIIIVLMSTPKECLQKLNETIQRGEYNRLAAIVKDYPRPADLNYAYDKTGQSILFKLVYIQNEEEALNLIQFFRKIGCDVRHKDNFKQWALHYAARLQRIRIVQYFLRIGFDLNEDDYYMQTPLFYCAKYNKRHIIAEMLIDAGCEVNRKDANGQTCIFYAASEGNFEVVRILVQRGANPLLTDKNKERALHYARRNGHTKVADYLNGCRNDIKRVKETKEERPIQSSSQGTVDKRKKKESVKCEYAMVYINQEGQTKVLTLKELIKFKEASDQNDKLFRMMAQPDEFGDPIGPGPDKRFEKTIMKVLNHFLKDQNAHFFSEPVNYQALGLIDYLNIVKYPMDFGTIKRKIMYNGYNNEAQFQGDMNLVFDNCILYNGTGRDIGKIALQMKTEFNAMFIKEFS